MCQWLSADAFRPSVRQLSARILADTIYKLSLLRSALALDQPS